MKKIIFDVGANTGVSIVEAATKNRNTQYFAFEPVPQLFDNLIKITEDLPNVVLINKAVSNFNGKSHFNVANDLDNHTVSSLFDMVDNVHNNWKGVERFFEFVDKIEVDVIRMDDFVKSFGIKQIDYFHCDAQGSDLDILDGFGEQIHIIKEGCVEAAMKYEVLYKKQVMIDQVVKFLESKKFVVTKILQNDAFGNEANIYFKNTI